MVLGGRCASSLFPFVSLTPTTKDTKKKEMERKVFNGAIVWEKENENGDCDGEIVFVIVKRNENEK